MTNHFAAQVRRFRDAAGMSQSDLAKIVGCKPGLISNYENGRRQASIDMLMRLCAALRATPSDLLGGVFPKFRRVPCEHCDGQGFVWVDEPLPGKKKSC